MAFYTNAATEAWPACWCMSRAPAGIRKGVGRDLVAGVNADTCGAKTSEIHRASVAAVLVIDFFSGENFWWLSAEQTGE